MRKGEVYVIRRERRPTMLRAAKHGINIRQSIYWLKLIACRRMRTIEVQREEGLPRINNGKYAQPVAELYAIRLTTGGISATAASAIHARPYHQNRPSITGSGLRHVSEIDEGRT